MNDKNWKEEYKGMKYLDKRSLKLLDEGAKSLSQSWYIGAMYNEWKKMKGYKTPEPPNCQSSFKNLRIGLISQLSINNQSTKKKSSRTCIHFIKKLLFRTTMLLDPPHEIYAIYLHQPV